jgi:hypothetical protein
MRILRSQARTDTAPENRVTESKFARRDDALVFRGAFRLGMVSPATLFILFAAVVGGSAPPTTTRIPWKATSAGTLISRVWERAEINDSSSADYFLRNSHETRGALTLRSHSTFHSLSELNRRSLNDPLIAIAREINPIIAHLSSAPANTSLINVPVVSMGGDIGLATVRIALAEENAVIGPEGAVPEPATWFPAALVAGAIGWSQRRRFTRTSARPRRPGSRT